MNVKVEHKDWQHFGMGLHLIVGWDCRYHQGTLIGDFVVSTVGAFVPSGKFDESTGKYRGRKDSERYELETIGAGEDSFYETMVFRAVGRQHESCQCPGIDGVELWCERYSNHTSADAGHRAICEWVAEHQSIEGFEMPKLPTGGI